MVVGVVEESLTYFFLKFKMLLVLVNLSGKRTIMELVVNVIKHHYAITFITPFWHHFELSYHNNGIIFREALSNRTGLEVMKMAVVQVAPALVLMREGLEYWWIVCSCQLGDQISSCLRSPFEKYALSCFRFYDDFLGKVLT